VRDTFIRALESAAKKDKRIFLMVGDLGFGVVDDFSKEFPEQFLNAGIAEQNMMGMAAGLSDAGYLPFVYSIANFPTFRCLEQIRNDVVYHDLPVTIVSIGSGMGYGTLGYSHFGIEDLAVLRSLPNLRILSPADPLEVIACVEEILRSPEPTYLRLGKNGERTIHSKPVALSTGPISIREGSGIAIFATGSIAANALEAASLVSEKSGYEIAVFSFPVIKPLDLAGFEFSKYSKIITIEEHTLDGGFGSAVLEQLNDMNIITSVTRLGIKSSSIKEIGSHEYLLKVHGLDSASISEVLYSLIN
jgi:transketolase